MRTVNADILIDCIKLMKPILSFESIVSDDMTLETTLADKTVDVELEVTDYCCVVRCPIYSSLTSCGRGR
jgi:hypothetical protein